MASQLERQRERFARDASDRTAFEALEEHYFLLGAWSELAVLYERHLATEEARSDPEREAQLRFRLGQVLEERRLDPERAMECYREAARLRPDFRAPLRQLRRLHTARGQWEVALQIAEAEARSEMRPYQRAEFLCEVAALWQQQLSDPAAAAEHYRQALEAVPGYLDALTGLARALEALDQPQEARQAWEEALAHLRGPDRAPALEALGRLLTGPLADPERGLELYREALAEDPRRERALDALIEAAVARERWTEVAPLLEQRFDLARGAVRRAAIAQEAGRLYLERLGDLEAARRWLLRSAELGPEAPGPGLALAEVERRAGDDAARAQHLERALELAGEALPAEVQAEAARLALQRGEGDTALARLREALARSPDDMRLWSELCDALDALGRDEELAEALERRAQLAGLDGDERAALLERLGQLYEERLDDPENALDAYRRAFGEAPLHAERLAGVERLLRKLERFDELESLLTSLLPDLPEPERALALCSLAELRREQHRDLPGAATLFEQALELEPGSRRALEGLARLAAEQGDPTALVRVHEREAEVTSDSERFAWLVGEIVREHEARADWASARGWAERWVERAPEDPRPLELLARIQEASGDETALLATLGRLDALLPGALRARNRGRMARLHARAGRDPEALEAWRRALDADPDDLEALQAILEPLARLGPLEQELEVRRRLAAQLSPPDSWAQRLALADLQADRLGDPEAANAEGRTLVGEPGAPPEAALRLEHWLEHTGRYEELAERWEARRSQLEEGSEEALALDLRRAALLGERLGRASEAALLYRALWQARPDWREAAEGLERMLRESGDAAGLAELLAERADQESDPGRVAQLRLERAVLLEESLGRSAEARPIYQSLIDEAPVAAEACARLEALLRREGDVASLIAHLEARLPALPESEQGELRLRIARLCRDELREPERAVAHLEAAVALEPDRAEAWRWLGELHAQAGDPDAQLRAIEGELGCGPEEEREQTLRAQAAQLAIEALDDPERATPHYRRLLELDPTHWEASEFEIARLEREGRVAETIPLLERRLAGLERASEAEGSRAETRTALRLRIAGLRATALGDAPGAIAVLEAALGESGAIPAVAEPLADLYQQEGRLPERIRLCEQAAEVCDSRLERADWMLRLGDALRQAGQPRRAAEAYRRVMVDRPDDASARAALRELYRELEEPEPLARLLEVELERVVGGDELPLRRELADLLAGPRERPEEALVHLRRIAEIDPEDTETRERAIDLAEQLGRADEALALLEAARTHTSGCVARARLEARRGALLAGPLGRPETAVEAYREALRLDPAASPVRRALRETLETLGRTQEALTCLEQEAASAPPDERAVLLVHAAYLAESQLASEAAIPWLERLRALRPDDPQVLLRLADLQRRAGRTEVWLRSLEQAAAMLPDAAQCRDLQRQRAQALEHELGAPERAAAALEEARRLDPRHLEVLRELERLYEQLGRSEQQAEVLAAAIGILPPPERAAARVRLAEICATRLDDPQAAIRALEQALEEEALTPIERLDVLRRLGDALRGLGRWEACARIAEQELASLPAEPVFDERRRVLHQVLARLYHDSLARPDAALPHLRALLETPAARSEDGRSREAEERLVRILRARGDVVELAQRLEARLSRQPDDLETALELGRLREERLCAPAAAAEAYRCALERSPDHPEALRGLRRVAERLGSWREVARALEGELGLEGQTDGNARAALWRRLGEVHWKRLGETTQASRAFAAALEADPGDLRSLRALEALCEAVEDWRGALDFYRSEIELLDEREPERRQSVWLRIASLAEERLDDAEGAVEAYAQAAALGPLPAERLESWASGLRRLERWQPFAEVYERWCDAAGTSAGPPQHVELARTWLRLERSDAALERVEKALALDPDYAEAWQLRAELGDARGDRPGASQAWAEFARRSRGTPAAEAWLRAAVGIEERDPTQAGEWLEQAVCEDPALAAAHAALARVSHALGRVERAVEAASRALALGSLEADLARATALVGARAAQLGERWSEASEFAARVLDSDPEHREALSIAGEACFRQGELAASRQHLERWLAVAGGGPERAHHCVMLAQALEATRAFEEAARRYAEALELCPDLEEAHAGRVRTLERVGTAHEQADAWVRFAQHGATPRARAERLVAAAEVLRAAEEDVERFEGLLREAVALDGDFAPAWAQLATLLEETGRADDALLAAGRGLEASEDPGLVASLWRLRARILEARGSDRDAAEAFSHVLEADPTDAPAALAGARLLRATGQWVEAAGLLQRFLAREVETEPGARAEVRLQLGRLLAGPLERVDEAIATYRAALAEDPELGEAREALAELLVHRPELWDEALALHRELLETNPARVASLRALVRLAQERGLRQAARNGRAILEALGARAPIQPDEEAATFELRVCERPAMSDPLWEQLRQAAREASDALAEALGASQRTRETGSGDPLARYRSARLAAEGELAAPALIPLTDAELSETLRVLARLAVDPGSLRGDGNLVNQLSAALGRRLRRRVKRALGDADPNRVDALDFSAWREELRELASAVALDACPGALRSALLALAMSDGETEIELQALPAEADLTPWVLASRRARALLGRVVRAWTDTL